MRFAGTVRFDIEQMCCGRRWLEIRLHDILANDAEVDAVVARPSSRAVPQGLPAMFACTIVDDGEGGATGAPAPAGPPYIRRPPYWDTGVGALARLQGHAPAGALGRQLITDHLSPSNAILADSARRANASQRWACQGDFNSRRTAATTCAPRASHLPADSVMAVVDRPEQRGRWHSIRQGQVVRM